MTTIERTGVRERVFAHPRSKVWEKWIAFSVEALYLALFAKWDPRMIVRHHGNCSTHVLTVLGGEVTCDGIVCGPATHVELPAGLEDLRAVFAKGTQEPGEA